MANIKNYIENIRSAIFGKEVRGSLADGLDAINKETENTTSRQKHLENTFDQLIINEGNSNAEIVDARVGENGSNFEKLGDRLDNFDSHLAEKDKEMTTLRNVDLTKLFNKNGFSTVITGDSLSYNRYSFDDVARSNAYDCYPGMLSWSFMLRDAIYRSDLFFKSIEDFDIFSVDGKVVYGTASKKYAFAFNGAYYSLTRLVSKPNTVFSFDFKTNPNSNKLVLYLMRNPNGTDCSFDVKANGNLLGRVDNYTTDYTDTRWQGYGTLVRTIDINYEGYVPGSTINISFENITPRVEDSQSVIFLYGIGTINNNIELTGRGSQKTDWLLANLDEKVLQYNPDLAIIIMGANDIFQDVTLEVFESNVRGIVEGIRNKNPNCEIVWITSPKLDSHSEEIHKLYNSITKKICLEHNCYHVDLIDMFKNMKTSDWKYDNVHLNKSGNTILCQNILNLLIPNGTYNKKFINSDLYASNIEYYSKVPKKVSGTMSAYWNNTTSSFSLTYYFSTELEKHIQSVTKVDSNKIKVTLKGDSRRVLERMPIVTQFGGNANMVIAKGYAFTYSPGEFIYTLYIENNGVLRLANESDWNAEGNFKFMINF